jgi:hypothetical protein
MTMPKPSGKLRLGRTPSFETEAIVYQPLNRQIVGRSRAE